MSKKVNNNGYNYVDLDLPSGTLWATMNVGASKPSDYGLYFQWGETYGYTAEQVEIGKGKKKFGTDWNDYKWSIDGSSSNFSKYTTIGASLELEDDAAHVNMGGDWHMPTHTQCQELIDNTTTAWTTQDCVNGRLFTSKKNGKSIFIPTAGYAWDGSLNGRGGYGLVWSSVLSTSNVCRSQDLSFNSDFADLFSDYRINGLPVRGVIDKKDNISNRKKNNTEMNKNLNLVDILKDAPKGTKLWSPIIGYCELVKIDEDKAFPIICKPLEINDHWNFRSDGSFTTYDGTDCVLFPSKESRDWSSFEAPKKHKHFEPFQKVLAINLLSENKGIWQGTLYSYYVGTSNEHVLIDGSCVTDEYIIPYDGNEDKLGKIVEVKG